MSKRPWMSFGFLAPMLAMLLLVIAVSCGGGDTSTTAPAATTEPAATTAPEATTAPAETTAPEATTAPAETAEPEATATPVPEPEVTEAPTEAPVIDAPYGELRVAFTEMGSYKGHPCTTGSPTKQHATMAAFESLLRKDANGEYIGILVKDWSVSPDNVTWTFNLNEGVQFHGGVGELTSEDVVFSAQQMGCEGALNGLSRYITRLFLNPEGGMTAPDDYTLVTNTVTPQWDMPIWLSGPGINGMWIVNKSQTEELVESVGMDEASPQLAGTGPWEFVEARTGEFWRFKAVEDHYRKTPYFAGLTFLEIPDASARIANFQTGRIDTFVTFPDTIPLLAATPGTKFMSQVGVGEASLRMFGQYYLDVGTPDQRASYKPDKLPWVATNSDVDSAEWERARKVREAMSIAIDRELIIEELLYGEGVPLTMWGWGKAQHRQPADWKWEHDVERAQQLMNEAGYEDGFDLTITTAISGASAEEEACEAIADMWADIGITAHYQNIPYSTLRAQFGEYSYEGIVCQTATVYDEPMGVYSYLWEPAYTWSGGLEFPGLNERQLEGQGIFDNDERFQRTLEIGEFVWDNVLDIGLYVQNNVYPLGPNVDGWEDKLSSSDSRNISSFEWAPHRQ